MFNFMQKPFKRMLQNRLDPFGSIIKTSARGAWMGNRGVLHDIHKNIVRPFKLKAWITCVLEFKGRKREVMAPNRYTELFALDEATAFAAGHRPCAECRRSDFTRFKQLWIKGNPQYGFTDNVSIQEIDKILHAQRIKRGSKVTYDDILENIADGTFLVLYGKPFLLNENMLHEWSPGGYTNTIAIPGLQKLTILTPHSIVNTFCAGYKPQMAIY